MLKFLLSFFMVSSAFAGYNSFVVCGDRALVLDEKIEYFAEGRGQPVKAHHYLQFVLKDQVILQDFISKGAVESYLLNAQGELVRELNMNQDGQYYSLYDKGRTMTFDVYNGAVHLRVYSASNPKSVQVADFYFNDCK